VRNVLGWLKWVAGAALATLVIAVAKPAVAGLTLRLLAVGVAATFAVLAVRHVLHGLEPAEGVGRRPDPRAPAELPRDLAVLTDELRGTRRRDPIPPGSLRVLRSALQHRLWYHHGLSSTIPTDDPAIRATVSANAYAVLAGAPPQLPPSIPASALPDLIEEVERL
jgi:hypothetical protein